MKYIHFLIGIFAIMSLYYLLTRNIIEGLTSSPNPNSCVAINLGDPPNKSQMTDSQIASIPSIARMQAINQAVSDTTNDMVRESAQTVRQIPIHPVPPVTGTSQDEISAYLMEINDSMESLIATYDSTEDVSANLTDVIPKTPPSTIIPSGSPFEAMDTMNQLSNTAFGLAPGMKPEVSYNQRPNNRLTPEELRKYFGTINMDATSPDGCVKPTKKNGNCTLYPPPPYKDGAKPHYIQCPWQCPNKNSACKGQDDECLKCSPLVSFPLKDCSSYESKQKCNIDSRCSWDNSTGWCDKKGLTFSFK